MVTAMPRRTAPPANGTPPQAQPTEPASGVEEPATAYLDRNAEYSAYVQVGLDDLAAGRVRDWEDVKAEMRARHGVFRD